MYKELVELIESTIKSNDIIKDTAFGELNDYVKHNKLFPFAFIESNGITYDKQSINSSFRLHLLDQRRKDRFNILPIINDMEAVSQEFIVKLNLLGINNNWQINFDSISSEVELYIQDEECAGVILSFIITIFIDNQGECVRDYGTSGSIGFNGTGDPIVLPDISFSGSMLYKNIITLLETTLKAGDIIKETHFGELNDYIKHNKVFPFGFFEPGSIEYDNYFTNYNFKCYLLDQVRKDKNNTLDIISEMEQVAHEYIKALGLLGQFYNYNFEYTSSNSEAVFYTQDEELTGLMFSFKLKLASNNTTDCISYTQSGLTLTYEYGTDGSDGSSGTSGVDGAGSSGTSGIDGAGVLSGGTTGQFLSKIDNVDYNTDWKTFTTNGYSYFPVWAEESSTIAAGSTEYAYGNGDETPLNSGIVIGVDCELYACGGEVEGGSGVVLEVIKNGVSIAETDTFSTSNLTILPSVVSFTAGDIMNFRTKAVGTSGPSCRPVSWFRVAVIGEQGEQGIPGADGDMVWQGAWVAGTYLKNDVVENNGSSYVVVSNSTSQQPPDTEWDLLAERGDTGPVGGTKPYIHLSLTTAQNHGGAAGTIKYTNWDGTEVHKDVGFTHSTITNSNRIQVDADGRYSLYFNIALWQTGSARTTMMSHYLINGTTKVIRGRQYNYSRGAIYGDLGVGMTTEVDLLNGDYIEVGTEVDDTDATYSINSVPVECELIMRKLA